MEFDLENAIAQTSLDPWDFVVVVGPKKYPTRALEVADVDRLRALPQASTIAQRAAILDLFAGEKPPIDDWDSAKTGAAVAAILGYQQGRLLKNGRSVARKVLAAVMEESKAIPSKI